MKQIIQMEENKDKNHNDGNMAQYLNTVMLEQIQEAVRARLKRGTSGLQVQRSNHSVTVSPSNCLHLIAEQVRLERLNSNEGRY